MDVDVVYSVPGSPSLRSWETQGTFVFDRAYFAARAFRGWVVSGRVVPLQDLW